MELGFDTPMKAGRITDLNNPARLVYNMSGDINRSSKMEGQLMKKLIAGLFVAVLLCAVPTIEAGQPQPLARVETDIGIWTVESGRRWYKSWGLYLRSANGTVLDAKPIGGGGDNYRSYIRRIEMQKNTTGGVYLLFVATDKYSRVVGSITDNNYNWQTGRVDRKFIEEWQEQP